MKSKSLLLLQVLLWLICAFHIVIGVGINVSAEFPRFMAVVYGATVQWTPQFSYILKPLGAFMLVLGILAAVAARNPIGHRPIILGFVTLFTLRALQRLVFQEEIHNAFVIATGRNIVSMIFFFALAAGLFALYRYTAKESQTG